MKFSKEYRQKLRSIADHYGIEHQERKIIEEMGEYIAAYTRFMISQEDEAVFDREEANAELADCIVLTMQLEYLFKTYCPRIYREIKEMAEAKIDRQTERVQAENERQETMIEVDCEV